MQIRFTNFVSLLIRTEVRSAFIPFGSTVPMRELHGRVGKFGGTCHRYDFSFPEYKFYEVACNQKFFYVILDHGENISGWSRFEVRIIPDSMMLDMSRTFPDEPGNSDIVQHAERTYKNILSLPSCHRSKFLAPSPP